MQKLKNIFVKTIAYVVFLLPRKLVRALGSLIGWLWWDVFKIRKKVVFDNLEIAFPGISDAEKNKIARHSLFEMGANFAEFFAIPALDQKWLEKNVVFEGYEYFQSAISENKGVLLLGLHLGHGDMCASAISMRGPEVVIISKNFKNKAFNDLWYSFRSGQGVKFIEPHGPKTPFDILKALKRKANVAFVVDQYMGKPYGIETTFFGRKTGTAQGLSVFVLKTGAPVVPVYSFEGDDGQFHVCFEPIVKVDDCIFEDKDRTILTMTQRFNDVVESIVRKYPRHWMWVHRRWKDFHAN